MSIVTGRTTIDTAGAVVATDWASTSTPDRLPPAQRAQRRHRRTVGLAGGERARDGVGECRHARDIAGRLVESVAAGLLGFG